MFEKWYKNSYRRSLVDMHIHDWNDDFLSEFSPEAYLEYLKTAKVDSMMLYLQSHVGLCYYPTKSGVIHKAFIGKEDTMKRLVNMCHENGIAVVGYYSLIFNTVEEIRHPEWRLISDRETNTSHYQRGSRYGKCCPNNAEYREFLKIQVKEIADYFDLDGVFFDMTFWSGICTCKSCTERFKAETGISEIPLMDDLREENAKLFMKKRYEWIAEFAKWITDYTRELIPGVSVSHNNAYEVTGNWNQAVWEGVSDLCDFCTGDLYGDIYNASFCNKFFLGATQNMPYEYMVSRFSKDLKQHTLTKTDTEFLQNTLLTVAHHGANFVIDAIDPVGTLDPRVASLIGRTYEKQIPYEKYIKNGENIADVAVWYSTTGRYNTEGQDFDSRTCSVTLTKTMIQSHIPVRVIGNTQSDKLEKSKVVLASSIAGLEDKHRKDILKYVENGGVFIFSGYEEPRLLKAFFGAEQKGMSIPKYSYIAPTKENEALFCGFNDKYPLPMNFKHSIIENVDSDTEILAYLNLPYYDPCNERNFSSIHSNPPGKTTKYPSVIKKKYGNGYAVWLGLPIEGTDSRQHREITVSLVRSFLKEDEQSVTTNAPMQVELVTFAENNAVQISSIDMGVTNERRNIEEFDICVRSDRIPTGVYLLPDKAPIDFKYIGGRVCFKTRKLDVFDMYRIEF